jgi:hypothetical protein
MVAIKSTMIALARLGVGIALVGIPDGTKLIAGRVTTIASGRVASVVLGSKVLAV